MNNLEFLEQKINNLKVDIDKLYFVIEHTQKQIMILTDLLEKLEKRLFIIEQKDFDRVIKTNKY